MKPTKCLTVALFGTQVLPRVLAPWTRKSSHPPRRRPHEGEYVLAVRNGPLGRRREAGTACVWPARARGTSRGALEKGRWSSSRQSSLRSSGAIASWAALAQRAREGERGGCSPLFCLPDGESPPPCCWCCRSAPIVCGSRLLRALGCSRTPKPRVSREEGEGW